MARDIRIIIAGGRKFNDYDKLKECMEKWKKKNLKIKEDDKVTVVCGCADGADTLGKKYAEEVGWNVELFPANWNILGKSAGILRNKEMAKYAEGGDIGYLVAFWNGKSRGTHNMIDTALQHSLPVTIYSYDDPDRNAINEYIGDIFGVFNDILETAFGIKEEDQNTKLNDSESDNKLKKADIRIEVI